ncbi:hypothetical protein OSB04_un001040 [Centaurea solstitialis]|uniref:Integrase catalytic domain-containing protein n=1 Tax=Centaurea solstitialis TaxID=347529 RepID=A0AA38SPE0_9ASTR|nr:hypothetical protein OSB04_un001040 [Centaurea solstitialis]
MAGAQEREREVVGFLGGKVLVIFEEETRNRDKKGKTHANVHSVQADGKGKGKFKSAGPTRKWNLGPQKKAFKRHGQSSGSREFEKEWEVPCLRRDKARKSGLPATANAVGEIGELVPSLTMDEINMLNMTSQIHIMSWKKESWYLDTGATAHVCNDKSKFVNYKEIHGKQVSTANGGKADIAGCRGILLHFTSYRTIKLQSVLHVASISKNLLAYSRLDTYGLASEVQMNERYIGKAYLVGGMYHLSVKDSEDDSVGGPNEGNMVTADEEFGSGSSSDIFFYYSVCSISLWHKRLAHTNVKNTEKMENKGLIEINNKHFDKCETCVKSKFTKKPFPSVKRNTSYLELIHSDIYELNGILTHGGKRYFITFCDDFSRFLYVYLLHSKDQAFEAFKIYKAEAENQKEKRIKILRLDRGGEYFNHKFDTFCEENGIKHERTSPFTPQQNGLAEQKNQTLVEMVNCMLNQSGLPINLWGESLLTACHIHNRITSHVIPTSSYELWKGRKPDLDYFRVWAVLLTTELLILRDPNSEPMLSKAFSKAYGLLDKETCVILESKDVDFFEDKFSEDAENSDRLLDPNLPGTSHDVEGNHKKVTRKVIFSINIDDDPKTFEEAMSSKYASLRRKAINDEMDSIMTNGTWVLADLPKGSKPIGYKWIFKRKRHPVGTVSAFKARLIKEGIDYFDTYAPVARISSIRTLIAISAVKGLYIHQMDVKTPFLNGYLNEEVYMEQPEGFVIPSQENKVKVKRDCSVIGLVGDSSEHPIKLLGPKDLLFAQSRPPLDCIKITVMSRKKLRKYYRINRSFSWALEVSERSIY